MEVFAGAVRRLSHAAGAVAVLLTMAACGVVCQMVFVRYVLKASTVWQTEFVLYSIVAGTLLGSPYVLAARGHVGVPILGDAVGPRARRRLDVVAAVAGIAFCAVLTWSAWRYFDDAWTRGWVTESVWAPRLWILLLPLLVGMGLTTLQYIVELWALLRAPPPARPGPRAAAKGDGGRGEAGP